MSAVATGGADAVQPHDVTALRVVEGSRAELRLLCQSHYLPPVRLAACLTSDRDSAEDVVQDAFVALQRHWARPLRRAGPPAQRGAILVGHVPTAGGAAVPRYDYRCRSCDALFEVRRGLDEPERAVTCPQGHDATSRVFTAVAVGGGAASSSAPAGGGGGCCGGGCCG